jgi:hypothetical protein
MNRRLVFSRCYQGGRLLNDSRFKAFRIAVCSLWRYP